MTKKISRRQAVLGVTSTLLLPAACSHTRVDTGDYEGPTFAHGVASGDPDATGVVIWTRISGVHEDTAVDWYVATDAEMVDVRSHGQFVTGAHRDYTVKQLVGGLEPGRSYFYRFVAGGSVSPVGRMQTLPAGRLERLVLAVASCSNFAFGYFNAYEAIANDRDVDFVVHLGDFIYEHRAHGGYGGATGSRLGRDHEPRHEITSLRDYRIRFAQYKADPQSIAMHARHSLIATWDDHESANNPWMAGAENHQLIDGNWGKRRAASLQAYYEWMPVRDPGPGGSRERYWRHFKFGDLASLITLESRHTGRSRQVEWGRELDGFRGPADAEAWYDEVVGAAERNMLSAEMETFLRAELGEAAASRRKWRIIGNQTIMANRRTPSLDEPFFAGLRANSRGSVRRFLDNVSRLGQLGVPYDLDSWDGYPAARERFYQLAREAGVDDLLVVSGDSHSFWANALHDAAGAPVGLELGTTGITSPPSFLTAGVDGLVRWDQLVAAGNEEVIWVDGRYRGYIRLAISRDVAHADYVTVTDIESRNYETRIVKSMNIEHLDGILRYS